MKEAIDEMNTSKSPRVEVLLLTNSIESILKDFMEFLLSSKQARQIPRETIVKILKEKKRISKELAHDVTLIFKIRDAFAHKISLNQANEYAEDEILPNLNCVKTESKKIPNYEIKPLHEKLIDVSDWVFANLIMEFDQTTRHSLRLRVKSVGTDQPL